MPKVPAQGLPRDFCPSRHKDLIADALLTQRNIAHYLVKERKAHYHFTVKGNQPGFLEDIKLYFQDQQEPVFVDYTPLAYGRIEPEKSGPQPNSMATSTFPTSDKLS